MRPILFLGSIAVAIGALFSVEHVRPRLRVPFMLATLLAAVLLFALPALAQTAAPALPATTLDLRPLLDTAFQLLASAMAALGTVALGFLLRKLHIDANSTMATQLHDAIDRALGYGLHQARGLIDEHGYDSVTVKNAVVAQAGNYLQSYVPALLTRFKVDPATLEDLILAHLGQNDGPRIKVGDLLAGQPLLTGVVSSTAAPNSTIIGGASSVPGGTSTIAGAAAALLLAVFLAGPLTACSTVPVDPANPTGQQVAKIDPQKVKEVEDYAKLLVGGLVQLAATAEATGTLAPNVVAAIEKAKAAEPLAFDAADKIVAGIDGGGDPTAAILALEGLIGDALQAYVLLGVDPPAADAPKTAA